MSTIAISCVLALVAACAGATEILMRDVQRTPDHELRAYHVGWEGD